MGMQRWLSSKPSRDSVRREFPRRTWHTVEPAKQNSGVLFIWGVLGKMPCGPVRSLLCSPLLITGGYTAQQLTGDVTEEKQREGLQSPPWTVAGSQALGEGCEQVGRLLACAMSMSQEVPASTPLGRLPVLGSWASAARPYALTHDSVSLESRGVCCLFMTSFVLLRWVVGVTDEVTSLGLSFSIYKMGIILPISFLRVLKISDKHWMRRKIWGPW